MSFCFLGATLKRTRRELVLNQGDFSGTIEEVADLSGDDWEETAASQDIKKEDSLKKKKKSKKMKVASPAESSDDSKEIKMVEEEEDEEEEDEDEASDSDVDDSQYPYPKLDTMEELESKPSDNNNMATCFFKDVWYEGKKYTFVYLKRKDKTVNVQMSCLPWLIQKLSYYYSIRGTDLLKCLSAFDEGRKRIIEAMREAKITNTDLVKELKITKKDLA